MDAIFFVVAIMGCGDGASQCAEARVTPVHYSTAQACQAAMPAVLEQNTDLSFPVITAACRSSGMIAADRKPVRDNRG